MIRKNGNIVAKKVVFCNSIISKGMGLRFRRLDKDSAFVFNFKKPQKVLMDMFFVFYPIDVVFLKNEKVVEIKENFLPFAFYSSKKDSNMIVELNNGVVKNFRIKIGDLLSVESDK